MIFEKNRVIIYKSFFFILFKFIIDFENNVYFIKTLSYPHPVTILLGSSTSWFRNFEDIVETRECHTDANAENSRISTINYKPPSTLKGFYYYISLNPCTAEHIFILSFENTGGGVK